MHTSENNYINREPIVAGRFYPDDEADLRQELSNLFLKAKPRFVNQFIRALIIPHAGYIFSGEVTASVLNQIDPQTPYKNIFLIGSSHSVSFNGASIYQRGDYNTPMGKVEVNKKLAKQIQDKHDVFNFVSSAHLNEHCLEVELPFILHHFRKSIPIVPIVIGTFKTDVIHEISKALKEYFTPDNLFIISSDFSHYPTYDDAVNTDHKTAQSILKNNAEGFLDVIKETERKQIKNLSTSACGWTSILTLLHLTQEVPSLQFHEIQYKNSGDTEFYGDKNRVVGYYGIAISE